jgi:hypothetical protein
MECHHDIRMPHTKKSLGGIAAVDYVNTQVTADVLATGRILLNARYRKTCLLRKHKEAASGWANVYQPSTLNVFLHELEFRCFQLPILLLN